MHKNWRSMNWKTFWQTTRTAFVIKNFLVAAAVAVALLVILLVWLRHYTEHGVEVEVPQVTGLYLPEAGTMALESGLKLVVVDSTYSRKVPLGTIVEQNPPAFSHAKHDRAIYVIINASTRRQIPIPDLNDASYRQAEATLKSMGIQVSDIVYEPSEYKDIVLEVRYKDAPVEPGTRLQEGASVVLVVGRGKGTEDVEVPVLQGRTLSEARSLLLSRYLTLGVAEYDELSDEALREQCVVYRQEPIAGTLVLEGSRVDIHLTEDIEKAITTDNNDNEEDFF